MIRFAIFLLTFTFVALPCEAAQWRSPDGVVAVESPDMALYRRKADDTSALVTWMSHDSSLHLSVNEEPAEGAYQLPPVSDPEEVLRPLLGESGRAKIVSVENVVRNKCPCRIVSYAGKNADGNEVYYTEISALTNDKIYSATAFSLTTDTHTAPDAKRFIGSFTVLNYIPPKTPISPTELLEEGLSRSLCCVCPGTILLGVIFAATFRRSAYGRRRRPRRYDEMDDDR